MTTDQKEKCRKAYYHSDIEPTLDRLNQIKEIVSNFEKDGANRLTCALGMKHKDLDEIEQLSALQFCKRSSKTYQKPLISSENHPQEILPEKASFGCRMRNV